MSNWIHVAGIIRIDGYVNDETFDSIIGKECIWNSDKWDEYDEHPEDFLPMGSEGTLQKSVWVNPNKSSLASYTISIFGDLRDRENPDTIIEWFKNLCQKIEDSDKYDVEDEGNIFSCWIRQATIYVDAEWFGRKTYTWGIDNVTDRNS